MTVTNQNFKVFRGDTHMLQVTLTQVDGSPYDPTLGAVIRWRLATSPHAAEEDALVRKSLGDGITVVGNAASIVLAAEDTDMPAGLYYHELKVWEGTDVATMMTGYAVIRRAVQMGDGPSPISGQAVLDRKIPTRTP